MIGKKRTAITGAALTALVAPATLAATQMPALAHYSQVFQGSDYAVTYADHFSGAVCDKEVDGHSVYAEWIAGVSRITADDGGDPGCDRVNWSVDRATQFRVCEKIAGRKDPCSDWTRT